MAGEAQTKKPLFSFVVLGDTHVNPDNNHSESPWATNVLANRRAAAVVTRINQLEPSFVFHVGDMVHPLPSSMHYGKAVEQFRNIFAGLNCPLHVVPGNHDLGDKPTAWTPAAHVSAKALDTYRNYFGPDHYAFDHGGVRFIAVNDTIFNTGSEAEARQWEWLQEELARHQRRFVFTHYPPFLESLLEIEHYDNLAEPARGRFCALVGDKAEAVFCGHVHNFFYNRIGDSDCYVLPATSAVRHDYSDLFDVPPAPDAEYGRDARSKLGFFLVEVFEHGHVAHFVHSHGETEAEDAARRFNRPSAYLQGVASAPFGVDMRIGWADVKSVAYSGAVDEFNRKPVRNDYILLSLWEMGLGRLRIPLNDLIAPHYAQRVRSIAARGHTFCAFSFDVPDRKVWPSLRDHASHLSAIEVIGRTDQLGDIAGRAAELRKTIGVPVFLSKLRVSADANHHGRKFAHFIRHGFELGDVDIGDAINLFAAHGLDGPVFTVTRTRSFGADLSDIVRVTSNGHAIVHAQVAGADPATHDCDNECISARVAEVAREAWKAGERVQIFLDTFCAHDRGYFPRAGLVDRRFDLTPAGELLKELIRARAGGA